MASKKARYRVVRTTHGDFLPQRRSWQTLWVWTTIFYGAANWRGTHETDSSAYTAVMWRRDIDKRVPYRVIEEWN